MAPHAHTVRNYALALPPVERAGLIEALLASFDAAAREAVDRLWAKEAESRVDAYEQGEMKGISLKESRERINKR